MLDASIPAGTNRWRMDGIRLETVTLTLLCTTGAHRLVVVLDDCPCNNQSPIITQGNAYGAAATMIELELHNLNIDRNIAPQMFQLTRLMATGCDLNGLYFTDSDAYIRSCDLFVGCNVVNAGVAGGWFEFSGSRIPEMDFNEGTSESVLATLCGGGNENVQCWSRLRGAADPNGILNWARFQQGATYYRWGTGLYLKTGIVGNPVWTLMT
jgi:hypothetical protein